MPSFEDFLVGARHQLSVAGCNRNICTLLVSVLESMVSSLDKGTTSTRIQYYLMHMCTEKTLCHIVVGPQESDILIGHNFSFVFLASIFENWNAYCVFVFEDESLKQEIEALKVSKRILSSNPEIKRRSTKSKKLVAVQRILSDTHEFLVEYLHEGKLLTRGAAKLAYKNFQHLLTDARSSGLVVSLSEKDFDVAWGTLNTIRIERERKVAF